MVIIIQAIEQTTWSINHVIYYDTEYGQVYQQRDGDIFKNFILELPTHQFSYLAYWPEGQSSSTDASDLLNLLNSRTLY